MEEKPYSQLHLIGLVASVITEPVRLGFFKQLLLCIKRQTVPLDGLLISIYIDPCLSVDMSELFRDMGKNVLILHQKSKKRQFVQYEELSRRVDSGAFACKDHSKATFLLFSDDDDIWNDNRVRAYHDMWKVVLERRDADPNQVSSICMMEKTTHTDHRCPEHAGSSNVDDMLECGCASFEVISQNTTDRIAEYHEYAVRPRVLREFCESHQRWVKHNRFADLEFRYYVCTFMPSVFFTVLTFPRHWIYFYRGGDYPSVTNPYKDRKSKMEYAVEMCECPQMSAKGFAALAQSRARDVNVAEFDRTYAELLAQRLQLK